jgi:hypothetical protein
LHSFFAQCVPPTSKRLPGRAFESCSAHKYQAVYEFHHRSRIRALWPRAPLPIRANDGMAAISFDLYLLTIPLTSYSRKNSRS